jgi:hypothetical protein
VSLIKKGAKDRAKEVVREHLKSIPSKAVEHFRHYAERRYDVGKAILNDGRYIIRGSPPRKKNDR